MTGFVVLLAASFLLGSFPTAYIVAKKVGGIDIRKHGSGNVGATNALRVLGKKYGALVFAADFLKGSLPAFGALSFFSGDPRAQVLALACGVAAILGHIFTPFLGFKGGKGISTGAGALCAAYPGLFVIAMAVFLASILMTRIVSLSSLLALGAVVPASLWYPRDAAVTGLFLALLLLVCWSHRENISRLLQGKEAPITRKIK